MFRKSFKSAKCKTLVRLAMSRIKLLRNKRDMQLKQMRGDLSLLLQSGQDPSARIRIEHIIREQNIMAAYDIIELFCELIVARLPIIESQSKCPVDLREALSSLIFAAPRCADIPELLDIRDLFGAKYGKEFVAAASELRPDCAVNRTIIEKLSVRTPNGEVKLKLMKDIAKEYQVDWDPAESEAELFKRPEDLLEGSSKFVAATAGSKQDRSPTFFGQKCEFQTPDLHRNPSRMSISYTSASPSQSPTTSANEQSEKGSGWPPQSTSGRTNMPPVGPCEDFSVDRTLRSSFSAKHNSFSTDITSNTSQQQDSHDLGVTKRNISGTSTGSSDVFNEDYNTYFKDTATYFKDTASAAKAAADSAEKAIAAARAAAQFAKQNNLKNHPQQAFGSFDPSLSDDETADSCNLRKNRKPYLHQTQSFHGYDHPHGKARVEGHAGNKNLTRSASGQISMEKEALDSDDDCEIPMKRNDRRDASHHGNAVKYYCNSIPDMRNYDAIRSERHSFGSYRDDPLKESNTLSLPPRRTAMVYSNNLASPIFDESDCTDSESDDESDDESGKQRFVSETRNKPRSELRPASQPPARPPPGVTLSTLNNSQSSLYVGLNSSGSHVHPNLPDYDALASRFESLKYQRK